MDLGLQFRVLIHKNNNYIEKIMLYNVNLSTLTIIARVILLLF